MVKDLSVGRVHELLEVAHGDLRDQGIHDGDHVHARFHVIVGHAHANLGGEVEQLGHFVLKVIHVGKEVVAAQMGGQGEGAADQAVEGGGIAHGFLHPAHDFQHIGNAAGGLLRDFALAGRYGRLLIAAVQGMIGNGGRAVVCPHQAATQTFRFDLQIEDHGLAVGLVEAVDLHQGLKGLVRIGQHLGGGVSLQFARVNAGEGHPGRALGFLVMKGAQKQVFHNGIPPDHIATQVRSFA